MINTVIFTPSTSILRGPTARTLKAGLFYVSDKGVLLPIKRRPAYTERLRNVFARVSGLVDSGNRRAAFLSANVNKSHHAHRNSHTFRGANPTCRTIPSTGSTVPNPSTSCKEAGKRMPQKGICIAGNPCCKTSLIHCISVS